MYSGLEPKIHCEKRPGVQTKKMQKQPKAW